MKYLEGLNNLIKKYDMETIKNMSDFDIDFSLFITSLLFMSPFLFILISDSISIILKCLLLIMIFCLLIFSVLITIFNKEFKIGNNLFKIMEFILDYRKVKELIAKLESEPKEEILLFIFKDNTIPNEIITLFITSDISKIHYAKLYTHLNVVKINTNSEFHSTIESTIKNLKELEKIKSSDTIVYIILENVLNNQALNIFKIKPNNEILQNNELQILKDFNELSEDFLSDIENNKNQNKDNYEKELLKLKELSKLI